MTEHPNIKKLTRVLDRMGGLWTAADLLEAVAAGTMQMFCINDSIAVTQINVFPRKRVLHVLIALGEIDDLRVLHERLMKFAVEMKVDLVQAQGRRGWLDNPLTTGWAIKTKTFLYQRAN